MNSEFNYKDCTEEQQINSRNKYQLIDQLRIFENNASLSLFKYLFQDRGEHIFKSIFVKKSNRNIITFFNHTSMDVKEIVIMNILYNDFLYSYHGLYEE